MQELRAGKQEGEQEETYRRWSRLQTKTHSISYWNKNAVTTQTLYKSKLATTYKAKHAEVLNLQVENEWK